MIINVEWEEFHLRFYLGGTIFIKEHTAYFEFITHEGVATIRSVYLKSVDNEKNIMFIDRYITNKKNIVKVLNFGDYEEEPPMKEEENSEEKLMEEFEETLKLRPYTGYGDFRSNEQ